MATKLTKYEREQRPPVARCGHGQVTGHDPEDQPEDEQEHGDAVRLEIEREAHGKAVEPDGDQPDDEHEADDRVRPGDDRLVRLAQREHDGTGERDRTGDCGARTVRDADREGRGTERRDHERCEGPCLDRLGVRCHAWGSWRC